MNLSEYLTDLSYKELSNLSVGDTGYGSIKPEKIPFVVSCINEALLRLYSKFVLKEEGLIIELRLGRGEYVLSSKNAYSTGYLGDKYIMDGDHPFTDDLIKVLEIRDSFGRVIPLNNSSNPTSIFTPRYNVLQVPNPSFYGKLLSILYQAKHPLLDYNLRPKQRIELPDSLMGALSNYVAYAVYATLNTKDAVETSQRYMQMYVALVQEAIETDVVNNTIRQDNVRFLRNGWC